MSATNNWLIIISIPQHGQSEAQKYLDQTIVPSPEIIHILKSQKMVMSLFMILLNLAHLRFGPNDH